MNANSIQIVPKPDWISWDEIHVVLWRAHEENRSLGINMRKPSLPGDDIKKEIVGCNGVMLVALDESKLVGTVAVIMKKGSFWYNRGEYGYLCFASLLPEYHGCGLYGSLLNEALRITRERDGNVLLFDTHLNNRHMIEINERKGFHRVAIKPCSDHVNVVMAKWLTTCPYSILSIRLRYWESLMTMRLCYRIDTVNGRSSTVLLKLILLMRQMFRKA